MDIIHLHSLWSASSTLSMWSRADYVIPMLCTMRIKPTKDLCVPTPPIFPVWSFCAAGAVHLLTVLKRTQRNPDKVDPRTGLQGPLSVVRLFDAVQIHDIHLTTASFFVFFNPSLESPEIFMPEWSSKMTSVHLLSFLGKLTVRSSFCSVGSNFKVGCVKIWRKQHT